LGARLGRVVNALGGGAATRMAAAKPAETAWVAGDLAPNGRIGGDDWTRQAAPFVLADKAKG